MFGGCGREDIVCCQGPEWTALKLHSFNSRSLRGSAGQQAAANEAFQGRCGDRFLSSLKQKSLPLLPHLYSTAIHLRWILIWRIWMVKGHWSQEAEDASHGFILPKAPKEQPDIFFALTYFQTLQLSIKPLSWLNRIKAETNINPNKAPTFKHTQEWMCQSLETLAPLQGTET